MNQESNEKDLMSENVAPKLIESHLVEGEMPVRSALPAAAKQHYAIGMAGGVGVAAGRRGWVRRGRGSTTS